jgi:signal transduction histidine kinase
MTRSKLREANNKMNTHLQHILDTLQQTENLSEEQKAAITKSLKDADKELTITAFKLDRTEKVKRTTAILLEETIEELELKRKAVEESNLALQKSLADLEAAQDQLVQQEKLASLGQLTAGIAHEIKNPLNFVNNFSEVSVELIEEAREELRRVTDDRGPGNEKAKAGAERQSRPLGVKSELPSPSGRGVGGEGEQGSNPSLILEILDDIEANLRKIHEHGSRADGIVKSMLMHSRGGDGKMEPTALNPIIKEYVNLAFHGMRAGKEPINVDIDLQLDESIGDVPLIAEDFSRVILNVCNNAFDAMRQKAKGKSEKAEVFHPKLTVRTHQAEKSITIEIEDNGPGIPDDIKDKIMQPFFTTKKGTQGTGLGLSITNDIVKAHGGKLEIESNEDGTTFFITLMPQ